MSAPKIDGQKFPDYEFKEYPKAVYAGGDATAEGRVASTPEEEAELAEEGFVALAAPEGDPEADVFGGEGADSVAGADTQDAPAGDDTLADGAGNDTITGSEGADATADADVAAADAGQVTSETLAGTDAAGVDADGDGHDDVTGQFVEGNTEATAPRKRR